MTGFLTAIISSLLLGRIVSGWLFRDEDLADRVVLWLASAIALFLVVPLALGLATGRCPLMVVASFQATLAGIGILVSYGQSKAGVFGDAPLLAEWIQSIRSSSWASRLMWGVVLLWVLTAALPGWFLPPRTWDAKFYHLLQTVEQFRVDETGDNPMFKLGLPDATGQAHLQARGQTFPNLKMFWALQLVQARGNFRGAGLIQAVFLLLWITVIWALGRRFDWPGWASALASLFIASMPEVMLQSTELYADIQAAACTALVVWALVGLHARLRAASWIAAAALAFGHLVAAKSSLLPAAAAFGIVALVLAWRAASDRRQRLSFASAMFSSAMAAGIVMVSPWIVGAWIDYGNPIYPIGVTVAGREIFPGPMGTQVNTTILEHQHGIGEGAAYIQGALESSGVTSLSNLLSGLGPQWLVLGLPSLALLLVVCWKLEDTRWRWIAVLAILNALVAPDLWYPRFTLQLATFAALAFGRVLTTARIPERTVLIGLLVVACGWNAFRTIPAVTYHPRAPWLVAYPFVTGDTVPLVLERFPGEYTARDYAREHIVTKHNKLLAYPCKYIHAPTLISDGLENRTWPLGEPDSFSDSSEEALRYLNSQHATHIIARRDSEYRHLLDANPGERGWIDYVRMSFGAEVFFPIEDGYKPLFTDQPWCIEHPWGPVAAPPERVWRIPQEGKGIR